MKLANIGGPRMVNEARWLRHVYILLEIAMKKGVFDIELTKSPASGNNKTQDSSDCGWFDYGTVSFPIINAMLLVEAFGNKPCLVSFDGAIRVALDAKHPFAANNMM
jgi:hypothetical protein